MLKYFAAETNYELLIKASWIIEMNPDIEVPFRLYEIAERSPAKKANLVKDVLNQTVRLLDKSGILGDKFSAYTLKLQEWVAKRNAVRYVKQVTARLDEERVIPELDKNIIVTIKQPLIRETFKEAMSWPISDLVKSRIANYLGIQTTATETANQSQNQLSNQEQSKEVVKVEEQTSQQQIQTEESNKSKAKDNLNLYQLEMLASMTPEKATEKLEQITLMISHKNTSSEIKTAALQCLTRCRLSGAEDVATRLIKNPDISIATAAVEYLGIVNPDAIFPYLGQCLNISDVRMKSAALGILKNYDYNQAISYLKTMLYSPTKSQQNMAMECINQFDFVLVRDMLTDFLCLDYPESLLEAGLCYFAANPSADNVYSLYKIEQAHKGKISDQAKKLREECPEKTEDIDTALTEEKINTDNQKQKEEVDAKAIKEAKEAELKERLRIEKEKKASKKPAYAYKSASELPQRTSKEQLIIIWQSICDFVHSKALPISIGALLIIAPTVYYTFIYTGSSSTQTKPKGKTLIANKRTIEGKVVQINEESVILNSSNGDVYVFSPRKDGFRMPEVGLSYRISIVPFREYNGQKFVKIRAMVKINEFSEEFSGKK
jgi:flagellar motor protein MotB